MARVCVVDDKEILRDSLTAALAREEHEVTAFGDPVEALAAVKQGEYDVVISDLKMPRMDGLTFIRHLRDGGVDVPVVMMTAYATVHTAVDAMKLGAFDYLQKPFEAGAVAVVVERALEHARLRRENEALRASVEDARYHRALIGSSRSMVQLRKQLERVASSDATVLISGESGTGKELVAWSIHGMSCRSSRPMLCLNCAALSANLLESELFGHEKGAFTGADRTRRGRFELADGGTLLLDEVSEMDVGLQSKLLRVLQEGEFERVGSSTTRRADVRIIATTNRNLKEWINRERFREDLYYRLNVLPVSLAPLREHVEDIPELVEHFLGGTAERGSGDPGVDRGGNGSLHVTPEAMYSLTNYHWPGNVRELENLCRRAATLCQDHTIAADLIDPWLQAGEGSYRETSLPFGGLREGRMLEDAERRLIEHTLARFCGHRAKSAKALGMGVRTLGMKLKQWREEEESQKRFTQSREMQTVSS